MSEKIDVGFVLNVPSRRSVETFDDVKTAVVEIIKRFDIGEDKVLPGVITYGATASMSLRIGSMATKDAAVYEIERLQTPSLGSGNSLNDALEMADNQLLNVNYGSRRDAQKSLYVFADSIPTDSVVQNILREMKKKSVNVVFIMYGLKAKEDDLMKSTPNYDAWFVPEKLADVTSIANNVADAALPGMMFFFSCCF